MEEHPAQDVYTIQIRRSGKQEATNPNCRGCVDGFVHVNSLGVRQFTQSGKLPGVCKPCNTQFLRICRLQIRHLTHKDTPIHICSDCQKTFTHAGNYRKHMLLHQPKEEKLEVSECSNTDVYAPSDEAHVDGCESGASEQINGAENSAVPSTSSIPKPPYTCTVCERTYLKYGSYLSHLARHDCESLFACEICKKVYVSKQLLIDHVKEHKSVACKICKLEFKTEGDLEPHLLTHVMVNKHGQEAAPSGETEGETVEVQTTPKTDTTAKEVVVSKKTVHYCSVCQKEFVNLKSLKNHLSMHEGTAGHECKLCKKRFQFQASLEKHIKLHLIKRPHIRGRKYLKKQKVSSRKYALRKSSRLNA